MPYKKGFISLYEITRSYGGPEEGGWWYDHYDYIKTYRIIKQECDEQMHLLDTLALTKLYKALTRLEKWLNSGRRSRFSVIGDSEFCILLEDRPGECQTTCRPHYE